MTESYDESIQLMRDNRQPAMANRLCEMISDQSLATLSKYELLKEIVEAEAISRKNNTADKMIKKARFANSAACMEEIIYSPERKLSHEQLDIFASNQYIDDGRNILLFSATGCGKSYVAQALGTNACRSGRKVRYIGNYDLMGYLEEQFRARTEESNKVLFELGRCDLLIIDDFLNFKPNDYQMPALTNLIDKRTDKSNIFCTQLTLSDWHSYLGGGTAADAILDRITSNAYKLLLEGESLRQDKQKQPSKKKK